jgi:hypothetical protein
MLEDFDEFEKFFNKANLVVAGFLLLAIIAGITIIVKFIW